MNIPNNKTPKLSTEEKINFTMLYPEAKSRREERDDDEAERKRKLEKARIKAMKPNDQARYIRFGSGYVVAPQYDEAKCSGGYMSAAGGYLTARGSKKDGPSARATLVPREGGALVAAALTAGALGIASALGSNLGSHLYHHAAPFVERGIHKFKNFFQNKFGKGSTIPRHSLSITNTTPLMYYNRIFKDTAANLKHLGLNDDLTKYYVSTSREKLFNPKLNEKIKRASGLESEGGIRKRLKHRHIAMPLVFNAVAEKYKHLPPAQLRRKATTIANNIYGRLPPTKLEENENHLKTVKKYIKKLQSEGKGIGKIPPNEVNQVLETIVKKLRNMGVTHYNKYKLKKAFKRYAKHREITLPSFKGIKQGADLLNRIDNSDLEERDKLALKTIGDMLMQKKRYMGLGKVAPALLAHINLSNNPQHASLLRKALKDIGTVDDLRVELKKPNSKLRTVLKVIGIPLGVVSLILFIMLMSAKDTAKKFLSTDAKKFVKQYVKSLGKPNKGKEKVEEVYGEKATEEGATGNGISPKLMKYLNTNGKINIQMQNEIQNRLAKFGTLNELKKEVRTSPWWKKVAIIAGISIPILVAILGIAWGLMNVKYGESEEELEPLWKKLYENFMGKAKLSETGATETSTSMSGETYSQKAKDWSRYLFERLPPSSQNLFRRIWGRIRNVNLSGSGISKDKAKLIAANLAQSKSREEMKKTLKTPMWKKILKYLGITAGSLLAASALAYGLKKDIANRKEERRIREYEMQQLSHFGESFDDPHSGDPALDIAEVQSKIPGKTYPKTH